MKKIKIIDLVYKIDGELNNYKNLVDILERSYQAAAGKVAEEVKQMKDSGDYTPKYIKQWTAEHGKPSGFAERMEDARKSAKQKTDYYFAEIDKAVESYVMEPVRSDFANRIEVIRDSGMTPSDAELKALWGDARTYLEKRSVQSLAEKRTKTEMQTVLGEDGQPHRKRVTVPDPYSLPLDNAPNMETLERHLAEFKARANGCIDYYSGINQALVPIMGEAGAIYGGIGDSYFRNHALEEVQKVCRDFDSFTESGRKEKPLSNIEKRYVDTLLRDPQKYPLSAKEDARKLAAEDPEIRDLLLRDPRFADMIKDIE